MSSFDNFSFMFKNILVHLSHLSESSFMLLTVQSCLLCSFSYVTEVMAY